MYTKEEAEIYALKAQVEFWRSACVDLAACLKSIKRTSVSGVDQYDEVLQVAKSKERFNQENNND